jgi:hypothetical protein
MKNTIKAALENVVLCRGAHSAAESYAYAEKMEKMVIASIVERLTKAVECEDVKADVEKMIKELGAVSS